MADMQEPIIEPVEGPGRKNATKTTHPSFAQVSASRRSGHLALYGSDFVHNNHVVLSISTSELHRDLSRDWRFDREKLIEIALSEAQWATLVSSLNVGSGVPCTLQWHGERIPALPMPSSRADQFGNEMQKDFAEAIESIDTLLASIDDMKVSKVKKDEIRRNAEVARSKLTSAAPFVASQFGEHMEEVVEAAKVEVHGYTQNLIARAGLHAMTSNVSDPLQLPDESDD